ncbi:MAG: hypothetical protein RRZ84_00960 [Romboutsia sp.]
MTRVTDFYQFKYSKENYYTELFINRDALMSIEEALNERLSNMSITKDSQCAYMRLKEQFQNSRALTTSSYVEIRINKCYLRYIKNLYEYFTGRYEYMPLKVLSEYLYTSLINEIDNISTFALLNEDIKVNILSKV